MMSQKIPIAIARGDGIGPEVMEATLSILDAAGAEIEIHEVEIGEKVYLKGVQTGIEQKTWEIIRNTAAFLKAPITTPQGGGFKSLNVAIRTMLGLYANVRPCISYAPFISTKHPEMDLVVIRENEEDLYAGIEYQQTPEACHAIKLISEPGSEKIIRYAFEYAACHGRKKVTCFVKDNILKISDGLFHRTFNRIAKEYPQIEHDHWIVDIGAAKFSDTPENFDVVVLPNLYGDILSDVGAQISGSIGLVGCANIGDHGAMFEAIHGSAPRRAGKNVANPSALLLAAVQLLEHIGQVETGRLIHNAWLKTIEEGIHTYDIYNNGTSSSQVGTADFGKAVIERLGKKPEKLNAVKEAPTQLMKPKQYRRSQSSQKRELVGTDIYLYSETDIENAVLEHNWGDFKIELMTNRGAVIFPNRMQETFTIDQWRVRLTHKSGVCKQEEIVSLLGAFIKQGFDVIRTEHLYMFDGTPTYSSAKQLVSTPKMPS